MGRDAVSGFVVRACAATVFLTTIALIAPAAEAAPQNCKSRRWRQDCTAPAPAPNTAPVISGTPSASVVAGVAYSFTPVASDANGNSLTFSVVNRPGWATFSSSTGRLSGTPTSSAVGQYVDIRISVSDGQASASLSPFSVTVSQGNRPPTISGSPPLTAREGQAYAFTPTAADADGNALTFSITNRPSWANFNTANGALTGTPGTGTVGNYPSVTIRVSDGLATASLPVFAIAVQQTSMGSATLSWQAPTTRTDGTPLTNLAGFRIRYGTSSGSYPNVLQIPNAGISSAVVGNLPPATYYFVISAYDNAGAESANTSPVSKTIT